MNETEGPGCSVCGTIKETVAMESRRVSYRPHLLATRLWAGFSFCFFDRKTS